MKILDNWLFLKKFGRNFIVFARIHPTFWYMLSEFCDRSAFIRSWTYSATCVRISRPKLVSLDSQTIPFSLTENQCVWQLWCQSNQETTKSTANIDNLYIFTETTRLGGIFWGLILNIMRKINRPIHVIWGCRAIHMSEHFA